MLRQKRFAKKRKGRPQKQRSDSESDGEPVGQLETEWEQAEGEDDAIQTSRVRALTFPKADAPDGELNTRKLVQQQNRKKKKSGGFQSMGLGYPVFKAVMRRGYKIPTPIQRKCIPVIMDGRDVVAMARTGSGKTAAFLIPMLEGLHSHSAKAGARALVLSPTRELALQTMRFTKELGRFTSLKIALILGGDSMEDQFMVLHENPDIIIGTPGRLLHVMVEMNLRLNSVKYVVFDEADRLFEMGFAEQLQEIIRRMPECRQTLLFSATLPKMLVDFAHAGLNDPVLIRLDVDSKLSEHLKLCFLHCRADDKAAVLLWLLRIVVRPHEQTVIFTATKHHVEYLRELVERAGIPCSYIYSALDQTARKINIGKFQHVKTKLLIVTDVAARGIDIPLLDNVINFHFPGKAKLFVHRVGRVARAGRSGVAYSLVTNDELPYLLDLHLFLGRPLSLAGRKSFEESEDGLLGRIPQAVVDGEESFVRAYHEAAADLYDLQRIAANAFRHYERSRSAPSSESIKRAKALDMLTVDMHPIFGSQMDENEVNHLKIMDNIKNYKTKSTIFEICSTNKSLPGEVMRATRAKFGGVVAKHQAEKQERLATARKSSRRSSDLDTKGSLEPVAEENIVTTFSEIMGKRRKKNSQESGPVPKAEVKSEENFYIPYRPKDFDSERGLGLRETSMFQKQASTIMLDLMGDDTGDMHKQKQQLRWDRKRKRFVREGGGEDAKKKMKTESGRYIATSYKSNFYEEWKKKYKIDDRLSEGESGDEGRRHGMKSAMQSTRGRGSRGRRSFGRSASGRPGDSSRVRSELRSNEQILKERRRKARNKVLQRPRSERWRGGRGGPPGRGRQRSSHGPPRGRGNRGRGKKF
uniref:ATP-dependent RNA helicase DDX54 n=1 Tax=Myxine glutinosa TaxID=7769 RepID=UPI00358E29C2